jgi:hypothetical protein
MTGGLVHNVVADVLGTPESRIQIARPNAAAWTVLKIHHHLCIINRDVGVGRVSDARVGVVVTNQTYCTSALEDRIGSGRVLNKEYRPCSGKPRKQLLAQTNGTGILSKRANIEFVRLGGELRTLPEGGLAKGQYRQDEP